MNKIILNSTKIEQKSITYTYTVIGEWKKYFTSQRHYTISYDEAIEDVPLSVCNVQFVANILPLAWIFDASIEVEEIDLAFARSIPKIKTGYINMYPQMNFNGKLAAKKIAQDNIPPSNNVGAFFSGGLDAMSTIATHYDEHPILINIQGSDINLNYKKVVNEVKKQLQQTAAELNLNITFVNSEFRKVINEKRVTQYIKPLVHDNYWHAFQHGLAISSHAAPLAHIYRLKIVYIASSFSKENHAPCASDPTIDNYVKFSTASISHDGYEYNRIDKSHNLTTFIKTYNRPLKLRVCLDDYRVENCCNCEKCYRTIFDFAANGCDPSSVGFELSDNDYHNAELAIKNKIFIQYPILWQDIQEAFRSHPELKSNIRYKWIYDYDFNTTNRRGTKYIYKIFYAIRKRYRKVIRLITQG